MEEKGAEDQKRREKRPAGKRGKTRSEAAKEGQKVNRCGGDGGERKTTRRPERVQQMKKRQTENKERLPSK